MKIVIDSVTIYLKPFIETLTGLHLHCRRRRSAMSDCEGDSETPPPSLAATRSRRENAGKRSAKNASKFAALKASRQGGPKMNYDEEEV